MQIEQWILNYVLKAFETAEIFGIIFAANEANFNEVWPRKGENETLLYVRCEMGWNCDPSN